MALHATIDKRVANALAHTYKHAQASVMVRDDERRNVLGFPIMNALGHWRYAKVEEDAVPGDLLMGDELFGDDRSADGVVGDSMAGAGADNYAKNGLRKISDFDHGQQIRKVFGVVGVPVAVGQFGWFLEEGWMSARVSNAAAFGNWSSAAAGANQIYGASAGALVAHAASGPGVYGLIVPRLSVHAAADDESTTVKDKDGADSVQEMVAAYLRFPYMQHDATDHSYTQNVWDFGRDYPLESQF